MAGRDADGASSPRAARWRRPAELSMIADGGFSVSSIAGFVLGVLASPFAELKSIRAPLPAAWSRSSAAGPRGNTLAMSGASTAMRPNALPKSREQRLGERVRRSTLSPSSFRCAPLDPHRALLCRRDPLLARGQAEQAPVAWTLLEPWPANPCQDAPVSMMQTDRIPRPPRCMGLTMTVARARCAAVAVVP